jgi:serine/threonine-protein kinase RsbW
MSRLICEIALTIPGNLDNLSLTTATARWICQGVYEPRLDSDLTHAVELSVSEACTNAIKHGSESASPGSISIVFTLMDDKLLIQVKDQGPGFNFNDLPLPDFENHPEGGYGVFIIKSMMDEVSYDKLDSYNILTMTKYIT